MPLNGSGTYAAPASSWNSAVTTTPINSTDWNALLADFTTALSTALYKDGQQTATAIIPFALGIKDGTLTAGRVAYVGANGRLVDSANMTFDGTTLTIGSLGATAAGSDVQLALGVSARSFRNNFTNLTNVNQNVNGGLTLNQGTFFCHLINIDGDGGSFIISAGLENGISWKYVGISGGNAAVAEGAEGVFSITGLGDGRTYTLTCSTANGTWALQSSTLATGTTVLVVSSLVNV